MKKKAEDTAPSEKPAVQKPEPQRTIVGRWVKGHSGNPGGRVKGLPARIQEIMDQDPSKNDLIAFHFKVLRGELKGFGARERMQAAHWLGDRRYGRAPETHLVGAMTDEQRDAAAELTRDQLLALAAHTGPVSGALPQDASVATVEGQVVDVTNETK